MPNYLTFLGNDGNYYIRKRTEGSGIAGTNLTSPTETIQGPFATVALLNAQVRANVFADCNYSEVAFQVMDCQHKPLEMQPEAVALFKGNQKVGHEIRVKTYCIICGLRLSTEKTRFLDGVNQ